MIAGAADQVVQAGAFASEDDYDVRREVEPVVILGAALIEADGPQVVLLEDLERADEVDDAGQTQVFSSARGGFEGSGAEGSGATLGKQNAVDAGGFGGAEQRAQVLGILYAVEGKDETGLRAGEQIFEAEEFALADNGDDALMGGGVRQASESVTGFEAGSDAGLPAKIKEAAETLVVAFARNRHVVEAAGAGAQRLFDGVQAVEQFHRYQSKLQVSPCWAGECNR